MKKLRKWNQLSKSEVELPFTELFGSPSPIYNEDLAQESGYEDDDSNSVLVGPSSGEMVNTDWEWMQEYGDISNALENCPGIYETCININDICCKTERQLLTGPTLAELNERRALSPLINPDMKRLHLVATNNENSDKLHQFNDNHTSRIQNRSCLMEINHPIPRKYHVPESVGSLSQVNRENMPNGHHRKLIYEINRPTALNSVIGVDRSKEADKIVETVETKETTCLETEKANDVKINVSAQSDVDSDSEMSDKDMKNIDDDEVSSGSEEEEEDDEYDDEATPTKLFGVSRKRKRSEAEDMTPNPEKLNEIGKQLDRLNRVINGLRPMDQSTINAKNKTRREKNKLASRACRLKKKAGHEANKIKFFGLNQENKHLTDLLHEAKGLLIKNLERKIPLQTWNDLEEKIGQALKNQIAGKVSKYVDLVLAELPENVEMDAGLK